MLLGSIGFVAVLGPRNPTSWLFGGMFAISTLGMVLTGAGGRGGGNRAAGDRRGPPRLPALPGAAAAPGPADRRRAARGARAAAPGSGGLARGARGGPAVGTRPGRPGLRPAPDRAAATSGWPPAWSPRRPGRSRASSRSPRSPCAGSCAGTRWCPSCRWPCRCGPAAPCGSNRPGRTATRRPPGRWPARSSCSTRCCTARPTRCSRSSPRRRSGRSGTGSAGCRTPPIRTCGTPTGPLRMVAATRRRRCAGGGPPSSPGAPAGPGRPEPHLLIVVDGGLDGPGPVGRGVPGSPCCGSAPRPAGGPASAVVRLSVGPGRLHRRDAGDEPPIRIGRPDALAGGRGRGLRPPAGPLPPGRCRRRRSAAPAGRPGCRRCSSWPAGPAGITALRERWSRSETDRLRVPIGVDERGPAGGARPQGVGAGRQRPARALRRGHRLRARASCCAAWCSGWPPRTRRSS